MTRYSQASVAPLPRLAPAGPSTLAPAWAAAALAGLVSLGGGCQNRASSGGTAAVKLETDEQKTLYTLGVMLGRNVMPFGLSAAELELVKAGLSDAVGGKQPRVELRTYGPRLQDLAMSRSKKQAEVEKASSKTFLDSAAKEPGAERLTSGLVYKSLKPGTGPSPAATDRVKVHYHGTLTNGTVFDSSVQRKEPAEFPLNGVIPCWTEGVQRMKVGEKARLVCPSEIAYGERGSPPNIPGGAALVFEIELLEIKKTTPDPLPGSAPGTPINPKIEMK